MAIGSKKNKKPGTFKVKGQGDTGKLSPRGLAAKVLERERKRFRLTDDLSPPVDEDGLEYIPKLPHDITELSGTQLGQLQGQFAAFADYVRRCLAVAEVETLEADEDSKFDAAVERLALGDEGSAKWRDDTAFTSRSATEKRREYRERKAMAKVLQARLEGLEEAKKTLSREQTRREAELGLHRRDDE